VSSAYREAGAVAVVRPFLAEMNLALNAATVAVSRSGASSLAEFAALRLPAILIPFPAATDNHQFHNARALVETGAARMVSEDRATPESFTGLVTDLMTNAGERRRLAAALAEWDRPQAARDMAEAMLARWPGGRPGSATAGPTAQPSGPRGRTDETRAREVETGAAARLSTWPAS
jgi:UDP-N-acetylglucosamine--N-acetylmuramyl-(pentapeptide) pyrophosphoryl-undecaprenol N-acetylglucosamine transferase